MESWISLASVEGSLSDEGGLVTCEWSLFGKEYGTFAAEVGEVVDIPEEVTESWFESVREEDAIEVALSEAGDDTAAAPKLDSLRMAQSDC